MNEVDIEKARAAQRAYAKAWRAKNPDKVREKNLRYWTRRAEREALAEGQATKGGKDRAADTTISKDS